MVPVTMMLAKLASYTVVFSKRNIHITPGSTFDKLTVHNKKMAMSTVSDNGNQGISKIPAFTLPTFQGNTLNGDSYL